MTLKYKAIKSDKHYSEYSNILSKLLSTKVKTKSLQEEIELLVVLINAWDNRNDSAQSNSFADPVALVRYLMNEKNVRAKDLVEILGVSKVMVSGILNYKKQLPKEHLRVLAKYFKVDVAVRYSYKAKASR